MWHQVKSCLIASWCNLYMWFFSFQVRCFFFWGDQAQWLSPLFLTTDECKFSHLWKRSLIGFPSQWKWASRLPSRLSKLASESPRPCILWESLPSFKKSPEKAQLGAFVALFNLKMVAILKEKSSSSTWTLPLKGSSHWINITQFELGPKTDMDRFIYNQCSFRGCAC